MVSITLYGEKTSFETAFGDNLYRFLSQKGLITAPCGGNGRCGRCLVRYFNKNAPTPTATEISLLSNAELSDGFRLACCHTVTSDIDIDILPNKNLSGLIAHKQKSLQIDPASGYGIAFDIGTTTAAALLANLQNGQILASAATANSQQRFGSDIISRIEYASKNSDGISQLHALIIKDLHHLINTVCAAANISSNEIERIVAAGNNTMIHILANTSPVSMGSAPYQPVLSGEIILDAAKFLPVADNCQLYCVPAADAFIGGDIIAGANYIFDNSDQPQLMIDIGTNGEMLLKTNNNYYATAVAASPAFEGMSVSCGVPAIEGAIDNIWINNARFQYTTIGNTKAIGIAGSGLIAAVAAALQERIISPSGHINQHPLVTKQNGDTRIIIDAEANIYITQKDIRQIQLAKSAIKTGVEILCTVAGIDYNALGKVYIAGGFGFHIKNDYLCKIGILAPELQNKIEIAGNTALAGALEVLLNPQKYNIDSTLATKVNCINLSQYQDFNRLFIENMSF